MGVYKGEKKEAPGPLIQVGGYTEGMASRFTYIGSVYLVLLQEDKILLTRRMNTGFEDGKYGLPSGHMDGNETVREACAREALEEIGVTVNPLDLEVVHVSHRKAAHDERFDFFMTARRYDGEITNAEPEKCDDVSWFSLDNVPEDTIGYVRIALGHIKSGRSYSEYGWSETHRS